MSAPRAIPCLLLRRNGLYKTVKFREPRYVGDPINAVRIFNDKGVDELVLLDIEATRSGTGPNLALLADIAGEAFVPLCYGGGVRSLDEMARLFRLGVEKVSINSAFFETPELVSEAAKRFGSQSVLVSLDVKRTLFGGYRVFSRGGTHDTKLEPIAAARRAADAGAGEIILGSVDRDGTMQGLDLALVHAVTEAVTVPVVAVGGVGSLEDIGAGIREGGASGVAAGSLFVFTGKHRAVLITYPSESELSRVLGTPPPPPRIAAVAATENQTGE